MTATSIRKANGNDIFISRLPRLLRRLAMTILPVIFVIVVFVVIAGADPQSTLLDKGEGDNAAYYSSSS